MRNIIEAKRGDILFNHWGHSSKVLLKIQKYLLMSFHSNHNKPLFISSAEKLEKDFYGFSPEEARERLRNYINNKYLTHVQTQ